MAGPEDLKGCVVGVPVPEGNGGEPQAGTSRLRHPAHDSWKMLTAANMSRYCFHFDFFKTAVWINDKHIDVWVLPRSFSVKSGPRRQTKSN